MAHHHTEEHTDEDDGPDMAKFASGFLLIVGMFACMTLLAAPLGIPMVLLGYWIYKKYDVEFEVTK